MKELRGYQEDIGEKIAKKLIKYNICYVSAEVRCGKTLMALEGAKLYGAKRVLFLTKKKAISSIQGDYNDFKYNYDLTVINYESVHKVESNNFDIIIYDESHCFLGNTLIDGVKIKDIKIGSSQKSFNFVKQCYEMKKVTNVFRNKLSEDLIKIKCNGKEIICTKSHKIFTKRGWVEAGGILPTDELQMV